MSITMTERRYAYDLVTLEYLFLKSYKMKKILINTFALIGFVTFILLACSVDEIADSSDNNNNNSEIVSNNYGKYQIAAAGDNQTYVFVLNTETGKVMKVNNYDISINVGYTFTH